MTALTPIDPKTLATRLKSGAVTLVDIREPDEFAREHIPGAVSAPMSRPDHTPFVAMSGDLVFQCKSGMRTTTNCERLAERAGRPAFMLEGGLDAWKRAGLSIATDAKAPLEINRQVQITAGSIIVAGVALTALASPWFLVVPAFIGAGLTFAGLSGWCGMANLLMLAPWNKRRAA